MSQQYHGIITIPNGNSCDTNNSTIACNGIYPIKSSLLSCMNNTQQFINNKITKYNNNNNSNSNGGGELVVTIASAVLLFCHFGITLYKIERNHPETSIGKQHLKDRWLLINICILVFAIASHLYRQALNNLNIKFPLFVLIPDFVTTGVVILNLTKHVYFALYLLMAGVTFLSISVSICDLYLYCFPVLAAAATNTTVSSFFVSPKKGDGDKSKYDWNDNDTCSTSSRSRLSSHDSYGNDNNNNISMDSSIRSINSTDSNRSSGSSMSQRNVRTSNNTTGTSSTSNSASSNSTGRKKATRSILQRGRN